MSSLSFCQLLQVLLADVLEGYQAVRDSSIVSLFRFVVGGTGFEGQDCASGDLFRTVANVTFYRTGGNVGSQSGGSSRPPLFVKRRGELRDCFVSWFGVNSECARVLVTTLGLEEGGGGSFLAEVGERGVAQLVKCPPTTCFV